jgi:DNA-binding cell septation regulator SpoVG
MHGMGEYMSMPKLEARVRPYQDSSDRPTKLLAFAELVIGGSFVIKGIRVLKKSQPGEDKPFVVFPSEKGKGSAQDKWFDVAHPVTTEAHAAASALVLEKLKQAGKAGHA